MAPTGPLLPAREPTTTPPLWLGAAVVLLAFGLVLGPRAVYNLSKWHWEDGRHFHHNRQQIHSIVDCFVEPSAWAGGAEATYRPLSANLYYLAGRRLLRNRIEAYHALDALLHLANGLLLFLICRRLVPGPLSLLPPALFVSRLAQFQNFAYTSNVDTLSFTLFCLAGLQLFVLARRLGRSFLELLALTSFGLALLCKEAAVVWPGLLLVYGWLYDRAEAWWKYAAPWAVAAGWWAVYRQMIRILYPAGTSGFAIDLSLRGLLTRYSAYLLSFANPLVPAVDPERVGWAIPARVVALARTPAAMAVTGGLAAATVAILALARWRPVRVGAPGRAAGFGLAWFFTGTAPFAVLGDRVFMRYSYFGHAGLAVALGGAAAAILERIAARPRTEAGSVPTAATA